MALLNVSFLMKLYEIIEPRLLEKRGFNPQPPLGPALVPYHTIRPGFCVFATLLLMVSLVIGLTIL